jgi:hypothetical protein
MDPAASPPQQAYHQAADGWPQPQAPAQRVPLTIGKRIGHEWHIVARAPFVSRVVFGLFGVLGLVMVAGSIGNGFVGIMTLLGLPLIYMGIAPNVQRRRLIVGPDSLAFEERGVDWKPWKTRRLQGPRAGAMAHLSQRTRGPANKPRTVYTLSVDVGGERVLVHEPDGKMDADRWLREMQAVLQGAV